jgi:hypothetical protein
VLAARLQSEKQKGKPPNQVLYQLQAVSLVFDLLRDPEIANLFREANTRIYRQL